MGIDYFVCQKCGRGFPDTSDYIDCSDDCRSLWCCEKCADEDGLIYEDCKLGYDIDDNDCDNDCYDCLNYIGRSCKYCREEDFETETLFKFALEELKISKEELIQKYKNMKKKEK